MAIRAAIGARTQVPRGSASNAPSSKIFHPLRSSHASKAHSIDSTVKQHPAHTERTRHFICQAASGTVPATTSTELGSPSWQQFAEAASGEWLGISCTYNAYGELQEIPYQYVPSQFREWGQVPKDWHTQMSCLADDEGMLCILKRLMPIVGCEADAVAYNEDERRSLQSEAQHQQEPKTVLPDGSYSTGPRVIQGAKTARVEHCIARGEGSRARIVFNLKRWETDDPWKLDSVELHKEQRDGPYSGTPVLGSCGYGMQTISDTPSLDAAALAGDWNITSQVAFELDSDDAFQLSKASPPQIIQHSGERFCLPEKLWAAFSSSGDSLTLEAGWLSSATQCRTISRSFVGDRLSGMTFTTAEK